MTATGFTMTVSYPADSPNRQVVANRIKTDIEALNPKLSCQSVGAGSWSDLSMNWNNGYSRHFSGGWQADIPSPYNWVQPYMIGLYAENFPAATRTTYTGLDRELPLD